MCAGACVLSLVVTYVECVSVLARVGVCVICCCNMCIVFTSVGGYLCVISCCNLS